MKSFRPSKLEIWYFENVPQRERTESDYNPSQEGFSQ
jgi:hypothetical protein